MKNRRWVLGFGVLMLGLLLGGCSQRYVTPGGGADMSVLFETADEEIQEIVSRHPASPLPVNLVMLRLQDGGYWSYSVREEYIQRGRYRIITTRDIEEDRDYERIRRLPNLAQVGPINRMLLPHEIRTEKDLRAAAARLRADMLFLYTVDTKYWSDDMAKPLSVITLGFSPNVNLHMVTTVSGVLYDVRTGFVYGTVEATEKQDQLTSWWANSDSVDQARLRVERIAFEKMLDEFSSMWVQVVVDLASNQTAKAN